MQTREIYSQEERDAIYSDLLVAAGRIRRGEYCFICNAINNGASRPFLTKKYLNSQRPTRKINVEFYKHVSYRKINKRSSWWDWGEYATTIKAAEITQKDAMQEKIRFIYHIIKKLENDN